MLVIQSGDQLLPPPDTFGLCVDICWFGLEGDGWGFVPFSHRHSCLTLHSQPEWEPREEVVAGAPTLQLEEQPEEQAMDEVSCFPWQLGPEEATVGRPCPK